MSWELGEIKYSKTWVCSHCFYSVGGGQGGGAGPTTWHWCADEEDTGQEGAEWWLDQRDLIIKPRKPKGWGEGQARLAENFLKRPLQPSTSLA